MNAIAFKLKRRPSPVQQVVLSHHHAEDETLRLTSRRFFNFERGNIETDGGASISEDLLYVNNLTGLL